MVTGARGADTAATVADWGAMEAPLGVRRGSGDGLVLEHGGLNCLGGGQLVLVLSQELFGVVDVELHLGTIRSTSEGDPNGGERRKG